jgi:hypothetical protein
MKREKGVDDGMRKLSDELEASLEKIWNSPLKTHNSITSEN